MKEAEAGAKVRESCRRHGISDATFYTWRNKYGLEVSEMRRLRQLEEENRRLKSIVADTRAGHPGAEGRAGKKRLRPAVKREMVVEVMAHGLSQRRACGLIEITRRSFRRASASDRNRELRERLKVLAEERRRWGCPMLYQMIRREGWRVNHKRIERLYREEGLSLRRRKRLSHLRVVRPRPAAANQAWALDFVHDSLMSGRRFRALAVIDEWSRESLAIEVEVSLTGQRVTRVLERLAIGRGLPAVIQSDNGPEFTSRVLDQNGPTTTRCGCSSLNRVSRSKTLSSSSFNSRLREECLNEHVFMSLDAARTKIEQWRIECNRERPHSSLGYLTPEEFAAGRIRGARPSRAPLGQQTWPARCNALRLRIQNLTVFRAALRS